MQSPQRRGTDTSFSHISIFLYTNRGMDLNLTESSDHITMLNTLKTLKKKGKWRKRQTLHHIFIMV